MDLVSVLNTSTVLAATAVLVVTQLLKFVPIEFTTRYPAWVNGILSVIAAFLVSGFDFTWDGLGNFLVHVLVIAVTAAIAYNHFVQKLVKPTSVTVQ